MDYGLRVDLRDPRFRDAQGALDLFKGLALEVVERDNGALLRREILDGAHEFGVNFARLDLAHHVVAVVAQRVDERDLVALFVGEKFFEREDGGDERRAGPNRANAGHRE